ncbi:MAG: SDR family oxidoreductase [Bacteroidales bacterium]
MKILLTGATGYIGKRLLPALLDQEHEVICCVRDAGRFDISKYSTPRISVIEIDLLDSDSLQRIPDDLDAAYYLVHSMSSSSGDFSDLERQSAENFKNRIEKTNASQVIYLSGIANEKELSKHLRSRMQVEEILSKGRYSLTTLRAGIIVGSGSASFEIIRDLVEKLPAMIAPKWLKTKSQPIAVRNVIGYLTGVLGKPETYKRNFDIGGPEVLTYKDMLLKYAKVRGLKRVVISVPVMTPRLSSYWLYFVTSTSYKLAVNLVNSLKTETICKNNDIHKLLPAKLISYEEAIRLAFDSIEQQDVMSSWIDAMSGDKFNKGITSLIEVPKYGCFVDRRERRIVNEKEVVDRLWAIGGTTGWYYADWLWGLRGFIDKIFGGVGLRRGRKSSAAISAGDALDFWRVLYASKEEKRLLLYAEMKLPGEAWLEFRIKDSKLIQTATFRPLGLAGRLYWYSLLPFHGIIFGGMIKKLANNRL